MQAPNIYAEIITIGDEILYGQITDTNSQWISGELSKIGIRVRRKFSIGDEKQEILNAFREAESRSDLIIVTGGLGPTNDDITKKTLCDYYGCGLVLNQTVLQHLTNFFEKRGRTLTELNKGQAMLPQACELIPNLWGTAPAMWFERNENVLTSLPGVPFEMKSIMTEGVIPKLLQRFKTPVIHHKVIRTVGVGESFLADRIKPWEDALPAHIKLAYLPSFAEVKLRLTAQGDHKALLIKETDEQVSKLLTYIEADVYGYDAQTLEGAIAELLIARNNTLAVAESCTGGYVSHMLTSMAGSSAYFKGGIVAYDNSIKQNVLGVNPETLNQFGAVSEQTVKEMAEGALHVLDTDYSLAVTGIAGPSGGTVEKPVGTIWIACASATQTICKKITLGTLREVNIKMTHVHVLNLLRKFILEISTF